MSTLEMCRVGKVTGRVEVLDMVFQGTIEGLAAILRIVAGYHAAFWRGRWDKRLHGHMRILGLMRHLGWGTGVAGCWHWGYEHGGINEGSNQPGCFFAKLLEAVLQIVKVLKWH